MLTCLNGICLQEAEKRGKKLFLNTGPQPQARANAAVLVGLPLACNSRLEWLL